MGKNCTSPLLNVQQKSGLNSSSKFNFRNDGFQPCELKEVQPICCIFCYQGEPYAFCCVVDQSLFLLMPHVSLTLQADFALLCP